MKSIALAFASLAALSTAAVAAPVTYKVDPAHTYPAFEADHFGGLSIWRGKFTQTAGTIVYDKEAHAGTVDVTVQAKSLDMGHDGMNAHATSPDMLDAAKFPTATFKGKLAKFKGDTPTEVQGELTLHGVTKPMTLKIDSFLCKYVEFSKKDTCGADASGTFNREAFGVSYGKDLGFRMEILLRISIEANKVN